MFWFLIKTFIVAVCHHSTHVLFCTCFSVLLVYKYNGYLIMGVFWNKAKEEVIGSGFPQTKKPTGRDYAIVSSAEVCGCTCLHSPLQEVCSQLKFTYLVVDRPDQHVIVLCEPKESKLNLFNIVQIQENILTVIPHYL